MVLSVHAVEDKIFVRSFDECGLLTQDVYPIEEYPFALSQNPSGNEALKGMDDWYVYPTSNPKSSDRIFAPEFGFLADEDIDYLPNPPMVSFDTEQDTLNGETQSLSAVKGYAVDDFGVGSTPDTDDFAEEFGSQTMAIMTGYNIFDYDLPLVFRDAPPLEKRWRIRKKMVNFRYGTNTKQITVPYGLVDFVDLYLQVLRWDVENGGVLQSHDLKGVAEFFGYRRQGSTTWADAVANGDLERYEAYDIWQTAMLASRLLPVLLAQRWIPLRLTDIAVMGTGFKIETLFAWLYRECGWGVPPVNRKQDTYRGAYVFANPRIAIAPDRKVAKFDFVSMYPSIIINEDLYPKNDILMLYKPLVEFLREERLKAKKIKDFHHQTLQLMLKIFINSFYGYTGASFSFADTRVAETITATGRELVQHLQEILSAYGEILEVDTDGVLVWLRPDVDLKALEEKIAKVFDPYQIECEIYDGAIVIKQKNYILLKGGQRIYKGNSLRNRSDENAIGRLIEALIDCALWGEDITDGSLDDLLYQHLFHTPITDFIQKKRVGKFMRQHRSEVVEGAMDGQTVFVVKVKDGWKQYAEDMTIDDLDMVYYLNRLIKAVGRLGGKFEEYSKRMSKKKEQQLWADKYNIGLQILKRRSKVGNLFEPKTV